MSLSWVSLYRLGQRTTMKTLTEDVPCDEHRPTAGFDKFEFRSGEIIVGCKCVRNDGMQHECRRSKCMGRPDCMAYPWPKCLPSQPCPPSQRQDDRKRTTPPPQPKTATTPDKFTSTAAAKMDDQSSGRARRTAARRMLRWAMAQYDDRPASYKTFVPCRVHMVAKKKPMKNCPKTTPMPDNANAKSVDNASTPKR